MLTMRKGDKATITAIGDGADDRAYRAKLLAMGLLPGTSIQLIRKAPLGDPIEIEVRGYRLSLRKHEAALLQIQREG